MEETGRARLRRALLRPSRSQVVVAVLLAVVAFALAWSAARSSIGAALGLAAAVAALSQLPRVHRRVPVRSRRLPAPGAAPVPVQGDDLRGTARRHSFALQPSTAVASPASRCPSTTGRRPLPCT